MVTTRKRQQNLQCHIALKLRVGGLVNLAHPARADQRKTLY